MPYHAIDELPPQVRDHLPAHAQEIFLAAFNHAYEEYRHDEPTAFRVAWSAVERSYEKDPRSGRWVKRSD